jgi:hypothetical protein
MRIERPDRPGDLVGDLVRGLRERHFLLLSDGRRAAQMIWEEKHAMHRQIFHAEPSFHDPFAGCRVFLAYRAHSKERGNARR